MNTALQKKAYAVVITQDLEDGVFIGRCDELHANSQGDTFGEIVENMKEAVELAAEVSGGATDFNLLIIEQ
ncbi:MAG: type II toxin-antitoxin system HicB family antitoxin [Thaumarchaeota archaeon]|nr:type II toxin-antitoxin system HicB family antitoxin [Nitrososphaerota archaeon]